MMNALFISLCLFSVIFFIVSQKRIHLFEMLFIWMLFTYLRANAYFTVSLNAEILKVSERLDTYWLFLLGGYTFVPALIVYCQSLTKAVHNLLLKAMVLLINVLLLVSFELFEIKLRILERKAWSMHQSFVFWCVLVILITGASAVFHRLLEKEVEVP